MSDQPAVVIIGGTQSTPARTVAGAMGASSVYDEVQRSGGPPPEVISGRGVVRRQDQPNVTWHTAPTLTIPWPGER
jgi:hypothetical protein